jgi:hypothetical protein
MAFSVYSQNFVTASDCITNPPDFTKLSYDEASHAVDLDDDLIVATKVKKICPEYIENLVSQLRVDHLTNNNKTLAIYLLGILHPSDSTSIEVLIESIDFQTSKFDPKTGPMRWGQYPAEEALVKIGKPVVDPILEHLAAETNELRRHLMCQVLRQVEGKETAQDQIKQRLGSESDSIKQSNLQSALKEFESQN